MPVRNAYVRLLTDEELRRHLERKETILFKELSKEWQAVERQVERLGFGESYLVTLAKGPRGGTVRVCPVRS